MYNERSRRRASNGGEQGKNEENYVLNEDHRAARQLIMNANEAEICWIAVEALCWGKEKYVD